MFVLTKFIFITALRMNGTLIIPVIVIMLAVCNRILWYDWIDFQEVICADKLTSVIVDLRGIILLFYKFLIFEIL